MIVRWRASVEQIVKGVVAIERELETLIDSSMLVPEPFTRVLSSIGDQLRSSGRYSVAFRQ